MTPILFQKERLTIASTGRTRFWIGLVAGVFAAAALSLLMNHFREWMRFVNTLEADLRIPEPEIYLWHNLFVTTLSVALSLSLTLWIWMSNQRHVRRNDRLRKRVAQNYAQLTFWLMILVVTRFGTLAPIIDGSATNFYDQLFTDHLFILILILFPPVIFLQNWMAVRHIYRAGQWMRYSLVASIALVFILMQTTTVNPQRINQYNQTRFAEEYTYIDREIERAASRYGITFTKETIEVLKQWYSAASQQQVDRIRLAFQTGRTVPLDTIILQKLVIRNLKSGHRSHTEMYGIPFCYYASPNLIMDQIRRHDSGAAEHVELLAILDIYREILQTPHYDWERRHTYTPLEARRALEAHSTSGQILEWHLKSLMESLQHGAYGVKYE